MAHAQHRAKTVKTWPLSIGQISAVAGVCFVLGGFYYDDAIDVVSRSSQSQAPVIIQSHPNAGGVAEGNAQAPKP